MSNDQCLDEGGTGSHQNTGHEILSSSVRAPQMWQKETLVLAVGKWGIFLRVAKKLKKAASTSMSVFYSWTSMTNASQNYAPDTSSFWTVAALEDAFVTITNPWPQILRSLSYVDGNMATKPHHPNRVYTGFSAFLFSLSCCVEAFSFLMPHVIIHGVDSPTI